MILSEVWSAYKDDKKIEGFSDYTMRAYGIQVSLLIRHFGDVSISDISLLDLKRYLAKDADRLKPSTIGSRVRFMRSLFKWAHNEGVITANPAAKLKEPKEGKRVPKFIAEEDIERIREGARGPMEKALVCLLYATGCRIGEVHLMNKNHIHWEDRSLIVLGKGNKEREVYFDTKTYLWLKEYINSRTDDCEALFITERRPFRRAQIHSLRRVVKRIAKRAGVKVNIYPHKYRHSFCTHLMDRGAPIEVISSLAGHQKIETTRIYAALSGERRREMYRKYF
ncbi:tyrosine-type recombinase/integrase [Fictibacillus aquaticus]|uniref:Integrase n=1 Tax=Fictibacillus aquaticus TaxID=2021314 RepID=A0A235FBB8_9BACL|nr:tyrosine-type recombinase/integrase [Fictibacillus aquaticus]OYD58489.1 integrase [Fictibacillus aquaticus]